MMTSVSPPTSAGSGSRRSWQHRQGTNGEEDGVGGGGRIGSLQVGSRRTGSALYCSPDLTGSTVSRRRS